MKTYNELTLAQELIKFQTIKTEDKGIMNFPINLINRF